VAELVNRRAREILFETYWSPKGWKVPRQEPSPESLAFAQAAGFMFESESITHDGAARRILVAHDGADLETLADNFVASLSRRLVHLRPALGSYYLTDRVRAHGFHGRTHCTQCGLFRSWRHDFGATSFARYKWGALPRMFAVDNAFLLERSAAEPRVPPVEEDHQILHALLAAAADMPARSKARDLEVAWQPLLRSSRQERDSLVEILVACGVLTWRRYGAETTESIRTEPGSSSAGVGSLATSARRGRS